MPYIQFEEENPLDDQPLINLTTGKKYKACWSENKPNWLRVWDDFEEDYQYPARMFQVVGPLKKIRDEIADRD
jgi:hypothetical protein